VCRQTCTPRTSVPAGARKVQAAKSPARTPCGSISVESETPYSGEQARGPYPTANASGAELSNAHARFSVAAAPHETTS
jgi:hypothetical protein